MNKSNSRHTSSIETIQINLDASDISSPVIASELIQRLAYDNLLQEIRDDLAANRSMANAPNPPGSGYVYFIDGTRGAGKSTFLQSAYRALPTEARIEAHSLAYIDPSRIEIGEIILLPVLKSIQELIERHIHQNSSFGLESTAENLRHKFRRLAGGLSLFAKNSNRIGDIDPELFLDWGLDRAASGTTFRENLHDLIKSACDLLKVKALILAFDDADTNAVHAREVLECIRMYLDTPNLLILVTGDMELYSQIVRDHFYSNLGDRLNKLDSERNEQRVRMIDHLEEQYLLKLFPIRRRIQLRPLWNLLELNSSPKRNVYQFEFTSERWSPRSPKSVIHEILRRGLRINDSRDILLHYEFLLKQPLRSILQVLSRCSRSLEIDDNDGDKSSAWDYDLSELVSQSLRTMALGSLYKYNIDVDSISAHELPTLIEAVFELTLINGDVDTGSYLRPQPSNPALKNCFSALSADMALLCAEKPEALLRYIFSGPGSVSLYSHTYQQNQGRSDPAKLRAQFKEYLGIGRKEDALNWAWHATAVLSPMYVPAPPRPVVDFGIIGLNKRKPHRATDENYTTVKRSLENCIASTARIPTFAFSLVDVSGQGSRTYASIFNILGLIDRLLSLAPGAGARLKNDVAKIITKVAKTPTISRPSWENSSPVAPDDDEDDGVFDPDLLAELEVAGLEEIVGNVVDWIKATADLRSEIHPSAILAGKIWTRLYFSLEKASENGRGMVSAASLMERFALCAINACLVEEWDHHLLSNSMQNRSKAGMIDRSNPQTSPSVVVNKFKSPLVNRDNLPLTFLIASCPLILGLLRSSLLYAPMLDRLIPNMSEDRKQSRLCDESHWEFIENTYIAGWKWQ
ncbi:P-loop NTPase fold protein [Massilia timonae]|jgi:hypothetical protein|uniref:P-loop NTPase fold protein n=1 Tax=Massilia timonae TaxID=47229 RepID=UPI0023526EBC|nr:P-loop NTPase fold protein [Massilia timonae]